MDQVLVYTIIVLSSIGAISAIVLYFVAKQFYVYEDPNIGEVTNMLPGANCGGCGFAGCKNFAEKIVNSDDISKLYCPVGGNETMASIAKFLGKEVAAKEARVAVVRCNGKPEHRPKISVYDGVNSCRIMHNLYIGEGGCPNGCLGCGDCVSVCNFDAIKINTESGLPEVDDEKCTACGACVKECPRAIIELRKKNPKDRKVFVSCVNIEKGAVSKKNCSVACIGCGKCVKLCPFEAITLNNNLAFIDADKCRLCRKCVSECPTGAIVEINFPARKDSKSDSAVIPAEII